MRICRYNFSHFLGRSIIIVYFRVYQNNYSMILKSGLSKEEIRQKWQEYTADDMSWKDGKFFGYVYYPGDEYYSIIKEAYANFSATNALNPSTFPSLKRMENEIVSIAAHLLNGDENTCGSLTSGGTESIFMSVKTAKDWAKKNKKSTAPELLISASAHPAFCKAADYMDIKYQLIQLDAKFKTDLNDLKNKVSANTIMIVGSAPQYPQGIIDPIKEMAEIASQAGCLMHVDACVGGFLLPFLKMNGVDLPEFDFSVHGVTSMSADVHKYGYAAKGASVVLYKNPDLRKSQYYVKTDWSGGIYGSPSFLGTRGGGPIAAAWTTLNVIGMDGYTKMAKEVYDEVQKIKKVIIEEITDVYILGNPKTTLFAIASDSIDVFELADELAILGWTINRQQNPMSLHIILNAIHIGKADVFLNDLKTAIAITKKFSINKLKNNIQVGAVRGLKKILNDKQFTALTKKFAGGESPDNKRKAAMYGMMSELSGSGSLDELVLDYLDKLYTETSEKSQ